jgi:hypothetical protein
MGRSRAGLVEKARIVVREDHDALVRLARLVQPLGEGLPTSIHGRHPALQILDPEGGLVGGGEALGENDPFLVGQAVREEPREQEAQRLRGVARDAQVELQVDAAIHVGKVDFRVVDRR